MKKKKRNHQQHPPGRSLSFGKQRVFRTILVLFPLLFLLLLEAALRLVNYGGDLSLFIPGPGRLDNHYICNRNVARRYFVAAKQAPTQANDYFTKHKPANGFRLFVLGGSTTNGYPYGSNLMFSRILEARLKEIMPDKTVEIVNVSMSAINSYTLLDFMDEILDKKPDALLIYAGHNEYYGALGAASMINFGRSRTFIIAYMKLCRFKTFLAVRNTVSKLRGLATKDRIAPTATLMERMVSEQAIPLHGEIYQKGAEQFKTNLSAILTKAAWKDVPVVLSELVSNVCDLAPFISLDEPESAISVFERADSLEKNKDYDLAKTEYQRAKDLDALRFRAPTEFNTIIHDLAKKYNTPVVAMESAFETASPHGLVGDQLMIDHLHPNIEGYFIMADAFFAEMVKIEMVPKAPETQPTSAQLKASWGYTEFDSLCGDLGIRVLKDGWPFKPHADSHKALDEFHPQNIVEEMAKRVIKFDDVSIWEGHQQLAEHFEKTGERDKAYQEYKALVALKSYSQLPYLKVSEMLIKSKNAERVPQLVNESLLFGESPLAHILLGEAYNELGRYSDAIVAFERAQQLGVEKSDPHIVVGLMRAYSATGQIDKELQLKEQYGNVLKKIGGNAGDLKLDAFLQRADKLIREQKYDEALSELLASLKISETGQAHMWIGQILLQKRRPKDALIHFEKSRALGVNQPVLLYNMSIALVQQKNYERAWSALQELERVDPDFGDPYNLKTQLAGILNK